MIIKEFTETTKIYPFELPQAETETDEQFNRRLAGCASISITSSADSFDYRKISCDFSMPRGSMSRLQFSEFAGKLNSAFEKAIEISTDSLE
jgi:hypothetical protein